jgi:sugar lactone lactonase YvrE
VTCIAVEGGHNVEDSRSPGFSDGLLIAVLWLIGCAAWCSSTSAQLLTFPGQSAVGSVSAPVTISVPIPNGGLLSAIKVLGEGITNGDFLNTGSASCSVGVSYPAGQVCTVNVSFQPSYPGLRSGAVVLVAKDGSYMGIQYLSGIGAGSLAVFIPGQIATVAGHSSWIYSGDGGLATLASIYLPHGIAVDYEGNLYIADSGNNRIRKVNAVTGIISTIAGTGSLGDSGDGGSALAATLNGPSSVAIDGAGDIFLSDTGNSVIRRIVPGTGIITTVAGTIGVLGYSGDGGPATAATFNSPNGIALDAAGNLFVADTANNCVRRVDGLTGLVTTIAGTGVGGYNGDHIQAKTARLNAPWSVSLDPAGSIYVADQENHRVRKIDASGVITTVAGTGIGGFSGDGALATAATLNSPASSVIDVAGNIYVADSGNNRVRKINAVTGIITTVAGSASQSISGDGGPATSAGLYGPYTLALDDFGSLYIADVFHNRIRMITANEAVLNFPAMRIGRVSTAQTATIENDGNADLNIESVQGVSDSVVDGPTTTCLSGSTLSMLDSCIIGASLAPTRLGSPLIGVVSLVSTASNSPDKLNLSGSVLTEDPSTTTLGVSANPIQTGNSVYFTANVTSAGVKPTGQITLLDGTNSLGSLDLDASGVATFAVSDFAGGQHSITASYAGDVNNTPSVSAVLIETVNFVTAPTNTVLVANANPVLAGKSVVFTATVAPTDPTSTVGTIAGPVTFKDGSTIMGAAAIVSGTASFSTSTLTVGQHSVVATYSGISTFASSSSAPFFLNVQPGTTVTSLASAANPSAGGGPLLLTVVVSGNTTMPTGDVTFLDGSTLLGTSLLSKTGVAALQLSGLALTVGDHSIVAVYGGDAINNGSSSSALVQTVNSAVTTAVVKSSLNPASQGAPVILTATVTSTGGIPGGMAEFFDGATSLGTGTLDPTGATTLTSAVLSLGSHSITARYSGDALDASAVSAALNQVIVPATTTIALTASANPSLFGSPIVLSVLVLGTGSQPTGTVTLMDGATAVATQPLDQSGRATFANTDFAIGVHSLVALYGGDGDHAPNNAALTLRTVQGTSVTLNSSSSTAFAGTAVSLNAAVAGHSNEPLTGTVQFKDGSAVIASVPIGPGGTAVFSSTMLSTGSHSISAVYSGDQLDQSSTSNTLVEVISIASTSTTLETSANPSFTGLSLNLVASVSGQGIVPTGSITFLDSGAILGVVRVGTSGGASLALSALAPGMHTLTASYSGDTDDAPSTSSTISESVVQRTVVTIYSSANPSMFQSSPTVTVTVSGGLAQYPPTGTVTLYDGTTKIGSGSLNAISTAHFLLTTPSLGQHDLTATYSGDTNNSVATAPVFLQNVILTPTTTTFRTSSTLLSGGQSVTFIGLVQGAGPNIPTGSVAFSSGATELGSAVLDGTGLATLSFIPPQGSYQLVAHYPGDALFAASDSTSTPVAVGPAVAYTMIVTPTQVALHSGDHTTLQLTINMAESFTDTVSIGCAGLPVSVTCTFSSNNVKVAGGGSTTLSMVLDTGDPLGAGATASLRSHVNTTLAFILPGGAFLSLLGFRTRRLRRHLSIFTMLLLLCAFGMLTGCGNSLNVNDTPSGVYSIQVIGRGALSGFTQSETVSLTVTK